jgi:protein-tyrosine phosphatase
MTSILFVCLGNICRSPMADAVMRHQVKLAGLEKIVRVDSAGTFPLNEHNFYYRNFLHKYT